MKVKDKEKLNNPLKGWRILSAISSMVFHTVQWEILDFLSCLKTLDTSIGDVFIEFKLEDPF